MSARTFTVAGFEATVHMRTELHRGVSAVEVEWDPRVPDFARDFTDEQRQQYRDKLLAILARERA